MRDLGNGRVQYDQEVPPEASLASVNPDSPCHIKAPSILAENMLCFEGRHVAAGDA